MMGKPALKGWKGRGWGWRERTREEGENEGRGREREKDKMVERMNRQMEKKNRQP